jgi:CHASE3 domain sensor protein
LRHFGSNNLEPFYSSVPHVEAEIRGLQTATANNETHQKQAATLLLLAQEKLRELRQTLELRRQGRVGEAAARVHQGAGKEAMDRARMAIAQMAEQEAGILQERQTAALNADRALQVGIVNHFGLGRRCA